MMAELLKRPEFHAMLEGIVVLMMQRRLLGLPRMGKDEFKAMLLLCP